MLLLLFMSGLLADEAHRILASQQGVEPAPLHWKVKS